MGIQERKAREKQHRRETIIKAAKKIILKSGVEGMSMNQLAELTELNKATLYLYYSNKDDLIDAIVYEGLTLLEKHFQEADQQSFTGFESVMNFIHLMFDFYKQYPVYFYTMNHQERRNEAERLETPYAKKGNETASRLLERIAKGLEQGIKEGSVRKEIDIHAVIILIQAQIYGILHTIYAKEDVYQDVLHIEAEMIEKSGLEMIQYYLKNEEK